MEIQGEPISPELVLVSPELRRLALQQLVEAAEQEETALPCLRTAEPLGDLRDALPEGVRASLEPSSLNRHQPVRAAILSRVRKTAAVIAFCAVEVVIVVAAVLLVKVIAG
jgi:hypothetical protein